MTPLVPNLVPIHNDSSPKEWMSRYLVGIRDSCKPDQGVDDRCAC